MDDAAWVKNYLAPAVLLLLFLLFDPRFGPWRRVGQGFRKKSGRLVSQLFFGLLALLLIGITLFGVGVAPVRSLMAYALSQRWTSTQAVVTEAWMESGGSVRHPRKCRVNYSYTFAGRPFQGNAVGFDLTGPSSPVRGECRPLLQRSLPRKGEVIPIKVNPRRPEQAVYLPDFPSGALKVLLWSGGFALLTGLPMWHFRRRRA